MNKFRITALILTLSTAAAASGCSSKNTVSPAETPQKVSPRSITFEWQNAYENKLNDYAASDAFDPDSSNGSRFDLRDLNGDSTPELIISDGTQPTDGCEIFIFSGGAVSSVGTLGKDGIITSLPESGILGEVYNGDLFIMGKYVSFSGSGLETVATYSDNSGAAASGAKITHEFNGEELLLPDFEAALEEYTSQPSLTVGRRYSFGEDSISYAVRCSESWGAVLNPGEKELFRSKLNEFIAEDSNRAFDICDLNGDDVPELLISDGTETDSSCRVFYLAGESLAEFDGTYGSFGVISYDVTGLVLFDNSGSETTYWSIAESSLSADGYTLSDSVIETGRRFVLTDSAVAAALA